jgi:large subunit ribosomal protein L11
MPKIKMLVEGGSMAPGPSVAQQLGPLGINIGEVISKVNEATKNFKGLKVPVELDINAKTKAVEVKVFSPPVSELLKKELGIPKGSGEQAKIQVGNAAIENIISVALTKQSDLLSKDLKACVLSVAGTCTSLGVLIENMTAPQACEEIKNGKYDPEINNKQTEVEPSKKKQLDDYFNSIHTKQEKLKKEEEAKEALEKEEKEAKAKSTPVAKEAPKA